MTTPTPPKMTPALAAGLKAYASALRPYAERTGDRVPLAMVECCDFLLIEAERMERGRP